MTPEQAKNKCERKGQHEWQMKAANDGGIVSVCGVCGGVMGEDHEGNVLEAGK